MSAFEDAKKKFSEMDDDEKVVAVMATVVGALIGLGIMFLIVALIKELFIPALIGAAFYAVGVKVFGWPIPKFVKKLFK